MEQQKLFYTHFKIEKMSLRDLKWLAQVYVTCRDLNSSALKKILLQFFAMSGT